MRMIKVLIFLLIATLFLNPSANSKIVEKIVAVVNGEVITLLELDRGMAPRLQDLKKSKHYESDFKTIRKQVIDELVDNLIFKQEIEKSDYKIGDQELSQAINNILSRNNITLPQLKNELKDNGIKWDSYKENLKFELKRQRFISATIGAKISITDEELKNYYLRNLDKFSGKHEIHIAQILFPYTANPTKENIESFRSKMEQLRTQIISRNDFFETAKKHSKGPFASKGGDLGMIKTSQLLQEVANAAINLEEGQTSQPIISDRGVHLIHLISMSKAKPDDFEKMKDTIYRTLYDERMEQEMNNYLLQLRQRAYIDIKE